MTAAKSPSPSVDFDAWPQVSRVETDRFCHACGYNLHRQAVRRDPRTQVLLCRCPECGTFDPATVPAVALTRWTQRFKGLMVLTWIGVMLSSALLIGLLHGVAVYFTLDEFTGYVNPRTGRYLIELRPYYQERWDWWLTTCLISGVSSFGLAFVGTTAAQVLLPHWKRPAHRIVIYIWAVLPALIVTMIFREEAPQLFTWSLPYVAAYAGCYLAGGLLAMLIGLGLLRLTARICLPPKWRSRLHAIRPE